MDSDTVLQSNLTISDINNDSLAISYLKYSKWFIGKYMNASSNQFDVIRDDLVGECLISLWVKKHNYDPRKGKFSTFAYFVCRSAVANYFRVRRTRQKKLIYEADLQTITNNHVEIENYIKEERSFDLNQRENVSLY